MKELMKICSMISLWVWPFLIIGVDLTIHDHTIVMEAIIINYSEIKELVPESPTAADVLEAALKVPTIDEYVESRIEIVLEFLPEYEKKEAQLPSDIKAVVDEIENRLKECDSISTMIQTLQNMIDFHEYDEYRGFPQALKFGIQLLQDGRNTIYNSDWSPYEELPIPTGIPWWVYLAGCAVIAGIIGGLEFDGIDWDWNEAIAGAIGGTAMCAWGILSWSLTY